MESADKIPVDKIIITEFMVTYAEWMLITLSIALD